MAPQILVSSYTDEIYTLGFDPEKGSLVQTGSTKVGERPSWATYHPDDPSLLYIVLETSASRLIALKNGQIVDNVSTNGAGACTICVKDGELFVANYDGGQLFTIPVSTSPPYFSPAYAQTIQFHGTGPNKARQECAHAHDTVIHGSDLLVPDLGTDRIHRLRKSDNNLWEVYDAIHTPPGSGPRHIAFYKDTLYALLELGNQVAAIPYPPKETDKPIIVPTSENVVEGMTAAEIRISYPYLYASNRDSGHPEGDSIAVFSIEEGKGLARVNEVRTGLRHVRGMAIGGADDKYLIAGGVTGGGVKVYERIGKDLVEVAALGSIVKPTSFVWVK